VNHEFVNSRQTSCALTVAPLWFSMSKTLFPLHESNELHHDFVDVLAVLPPRVSAYGWGSSATVRTISATTLPTAALHGSSNRLESTAQLQRKDKPFPAPILRRRSLLGDHRQSRRAPFKSEVRHGAAETKGYRGKRGLQMKRRNKYPISRFVVLALSAIATVTLLSLRSVTASSLLTESLRMLFPTA
jgi:hypothetical protein